MADTTPLVMKPREDWFRWACLALAVVGALDSIYLTWIKLAKSQALFCTAGGGCDTVNNSPYSQINGIPIAVLGLGTYLIVIALLALENRIKVLKTYGPLAIFGLALTGTLYSAYLTYLELFVIHAICPYCVVSAVVVTSILILSIIRLLRSRPDEAETAADET
jgi:uncharacterized membrane protein